MFHKTPIYPRFGNVVFVFLFFLFLLCKHQLDLLTPTFLLIDSRTLLSEEKLESSLQRDALTRPLVVGGEAGGVGRLCDLSVGDLLEGVEAGAV